MSSVAQGQRSVSLALDLLGLLSAAGEAALRLEEAAYEEAEPGLVYVARSIRGRLEEGRVLLEKVLVAKGVL